jgi:hypothetical protein
MQRVLELLLEHECLTVRIGEILETWVGTSEEVMGQELVTAAFRRLAVRNELVDYYRAAT